MSETNPHLPSFVPLKPDSDDDNDDDNDDNQPRITPLDGGEDND